jgi:hypothetical protein
VTDELKSELAEVLTDVDIALGSYGIAFSSTHMSDADRSAAFEKARLALRRARERLDKLT